VFNPAFDVTPAELITAVVTENGLFSPQAAVREDAS
jgi:methylthioribose-1-phosphate isomerase